MTLARLDIDAFRCLERVRLELDPCYNLFVGANASGKTSLLEAIFFLGRGRSFRTRRLDRLVRQQNEAFQIVGRIQQGSSQLVMGIGGDRKSTEIRIAGAQAHSAAELASYFAPQIIDPEIHKLLEEGPHRRRRFLDWGVFHVEHQFLEVWHRYHRALKQRNAVLKPGSPASAINAWSQELTTAGERLDALRRAYLQRLAPILSDYGQRLLRLPVSIVYQSGWNADRSFAEALDHSTERDCRYGLTHVGPHRADISVRVDAQIAKERVSRGQQKLLAAALTLGQLALQESDVQGRGALLLDDPAAELDARSLEVLLDLVRELSVQMFVTGLRPDLPGLGAPGAMFHVEHGVIRAG
jgi:DNA replication and repair protein RecF